MAADLPALSSQRDSPPPQTSGCVCPRRLPVPHEFLDVELQGLGRMLLQVDMILANAATSTPRRCQLPAEWTSEGLLGPLATCCRCD